ncbi:TetR/AcrR family transcriptional regulator [Spirosoma sp. KUDC1026]|uniref:TetR/AcrR family transcriptional regulator n=1 Tax=Spirosoma sp. KUDC1026 TaxID=2745947 RepID=UPI00159BA611|nr:TetR/AcrR family transcriptional regulator [Spirosoma sp. KUDC1026]QKZ14050.1 TetR/AcrR family transcriptional regulator [Spirosoma sp. KUDC1026]
MQRDRAQTEKRLIEAVWQIITESGFDKIGINRIASRSGINKILIYRYFGGLDGLLQAYYQQTRSTIIPPINLDDFRHLSLEQFFEKSCDYLIDMYRRFRHDVEAQEFLKAGLLSATDTNPIPSEREQQLRQVLDELSAIVQIENGRAIVAILSSALAVLTIREQQSQPVLGIDLHTDEGVKQIEAAFRLIYRGMYLYTQNKLDSQERS